MKNKLIKILGLILLCNNMWAQEFEFTVFFQDSLGNRDSIVLGYDDNSTVGVDTAFDEVDVISTPWDSVFDVRIVHEWEFNMYDSVPFMLQRQIFPNGNEIGSSYIAAILIKSEHFPVTVTWDSTLFYVEDRSRSLLTDWHPGGWFDAGGGSGIYYLAESDSAVFPDPDVYETSRVYNGDTVGVVYITFNSSLFVNVNEICIDVEKPQMSIDNAGNVTITAGEIKTATVYDLWGRKLYESSDENFSIAHLQPGVYVIQVCTKNAKYNFKIQR